MVNESRHSGGSAHPPAAGGGKPSFLVWTWVLVGVVTAVRLAYLAWFCPYSLVEDEAFYWEWTRRLAASYYTKGPGIAWTIWASTSWLGDTPFAVRLPAVLCGAVTALTLAWLALSIGRDEEPDAGASRSKTAPLLAAAGFLLVPMFQITGLLMTIDGPYASCWSLACVAAWRALARRSGPAWIGLGLALGVGLLYKYTILLIIPGLILFAIARRSQLRLSERWKLWAGAGLLTFLAAVTPVIWWNSTQGWPTISHLLGHLGVRGGDMPVTQGVGGGWRYKPGWTLSFLATQIGMVGPLLGIMLIGLWRWRHWPRAVAVAADRPLPASFGDIFLIWIGLPIVLFYLLVSFVAEPEGNWSLAAYLTGIVLAARVIERAWGGVVLSAHVRRLWSATVVIGVVTGIAMPKLDWVHRAVQPLYERISGGPKRPLVPLGRFTGAAELASHVGRLATRLEDQTGLEPFVIAVQYGRAGQVAFYLNMQRFRLATGRPISITCSNSLMGGRTTQYDYWPDSDLMDTRRWAGRPAVLLGEQDIEKWRAVFEDVVPIGKLDGDLKVTKDGTPTRPAYLGYGFRGFPQSYRRINGQNPTPRGDGS